MNRTIYEQLGSGFNCESDAGAPGGFACIANQIGPGDYTTIDACIDAPNGCKKWECQTTPSVKKKPVKKSKKRRNIREAAPPPSVCVAVNNHNAPYSNPTDCNNNCSSDSWNCNNGVCSDPGTGLGQYSSLSSCQSNCTLPGKAIYACSCAEFQANQGSCPSSSTWHTNKKTVLGWPTSTQAAVGDQFKDYSNTKRIVSSVHTPTQSGQDLFLWLVGNAICVYTPPITYDCWGANGCLQNWNGTGAYNGGTTAQNYAACDAACIAPSWDCDYINQQCSDPGDGSGQYSSLNSCQSACQITYECDGNGNCSDPGDGSGQYTNLTTCEDACYTGGWWCEGNTTCKKDPQHWMIQYSTKQECQTNCGNINCCPVWVCVNNYNPKTKSVADSSSGQLKEKVNKTNKCCRFIELCGDYGGNFPWHLVESSGVPPEEFNKILKEELIMEAPWPCNMSASNYYGVWLSLTKEECVQPPSWTTSTGDAAPKCGPCLMRAPRDHDMEAKMNSTSKEKDTPTRLNIKEATQFFNKLKKEGSVKPFTINEEYYKEIANLVEEIYRTRTLLKG